jgi:hypothetical protein
LLAERAARAKEIPFDDAVHFDDQRGFRFAIRVIAREIVGEEFAILENRVDWLAEEARLAAKAAHGFAVARFVITDEDAFGESHDLT